MGYNKQYPYTFCNGRFEEGLVLGKQKNTLHAGLFRNEAREQCADYSLPSIMYKRVSFIIVQSIKKSKLR
jgi:two-component system sensor histidine kinase/response regulator